MDQQATHWATGVWLLLCTGLAGIVVLELSSPIAPQVIAAVPAAPFLEFAPEPDPFDAPPSHRFAEIGARPLFSESRRPSVPDIKAGQELPRDENIALELVGTLLTEEGRAALLQLRGENARWLRAGERLAGWQLETVERNRARLRRDDASTTVELRREVAEPPPLPQEAERQHLRAGTERDESDASQNAEQERESAEDGEHAQGEPSTD
jgi:general secretion pathway protein N